MEEETPKKSIIISPHPDDELIGTYTYLKKTKNTSIIIYTEKCDKTRTNEALSLKNHIPVIQFFQSNIPHQLVNKEYTYLFPDPIYEIHPAHRTQGNIGERMLRDGHDVIFYSISMNAPYIIEVEDTAGKEKLLNDVYMTQKSLWEYQKKYILFEGYCNWILKWA